MAKLLGGSLPLLGLLLAGCRGDVCGNEVVSEVSAPGGAARAVLFQRDCGATTGSSTQISVVRRGAGLSGAGNAFVADGDHGAAVPFAWGGPWADMRWTSPAHLVIRYDQKARVFV